MYYANVSDYEFSSLRREFEQAASHIRAQKYRMESANRDVVSLVRDLKSSLSSYKRAVGENLRDAQRNAERSGARVSYYSSLSSRGVSSAERSVDQSVMRLESKIAELERNCSDAYSQHEKLASAGVKISALFDRFRDQEKQMKSKIAEMTSEAESAKRKMANLSAAGGVGTIAAIAESDRRRRSAEAEAAQLRRENAQSELRAARERNSAEAERGRLLSLLSAARKELDERMLNQTDAATAANCEASCEQVTDIADAYAQLWNRVLDDGIIELNEVKELYEWLGRNESNTEEWESLREQCERILCNNMVDDSASRCLYVYSLDYLRSLGVTIDE